MKWTNEQWKRKIVIINIISSSCETQWKSWWLCVLWSNGDILSIGHDVIYFMIHLNCYTLLFRVVKHFFFFSVSLCVDFYGSYYGKEMIPEWIIDTYIIVFGECESNFRFFLFLLTPKHLAKSLTFLVTFSPPFINSPTIAIPPWWWWSVVYSTDITYYLKYQFNVAQNGKAFGRCIISPSCTHISDRYSITTICVY